MCNRCVVVLGVCDRLRTAATQNRARKRPACVYSKPVGDEFHYGHLGTDVLSQAREVRLDLASVTFDILPQARAVKARPPKENI
jgi:hypothetical protein